MKVLVTIPCLSLGGTEIQTLQLASALKSLGYETSLLCYFEHTGEMVKEFDKAGIPVVLLNLDRNLSPFRLLTLLAREFRRVGPGIVHVQYMAPGFIPILAARLSGIGKILATVHQTGTIYGRIPKWLVRAGALLTTRFLCVSLAVEKSWFPDASLFDGSDLEVLKRKHFTIYNSLDIREFEKITGSSDVMALRQRMGITDEFVVGAVSRLRYEKGLDVLIRAFAKVLATIPHSRLLIVGDGPDRKSLTDLAGSLGISEKIVWAGNRTREEVIRLFSLMDVVAVPSRQEGFGLTAIEAMAAAKPVIASATGGLTEVITDQADGILTPPGEDQPLADSICHLYHHPGMKQEISLNGKKKVHELFSMERFTDTISVLYSMISRNA